MFSKKQADFLCFYLLLDDGGYSTWVAWSQCSKSCGNGRHSRSRTCTNPPPSPGGKDCSGLGPDEQEGDCNNGGCPGTFTLGWLVLVSNTFKNQY